ncbi:hypothetical protein KJ359_009677 [Pestalotiopsis sp. 9143b]|nr:hypothetical protein KJ359_009677 [Pestalotiopsis sp. 9143b]
MPDFLGLLGLDDQGNIISDPTTVLSVAFSGTLLGMSLSMAMYEVFSVSLTQKSMFLGPEGDAFWEAHGGRLMSNGAGRAGAVGGFFKRLGFAFVLGLLALPFMPLFVMHEVILVLGSFASSCFYTLMQ